MLPRCIKNSQRHDRTCCRTVSEPWLRAPGVNGVPAGLPAPIFNDNVILGNDISANSQDSEDASTGGPTGINIFSLAPMTGTMISQNVITQQSFDIVIN